MNTVQKTSSQSLQTKNEKEMEFVPFGAQDKIKLSIQIVQNVCAVPTRSGKVCSVRDAVKFMMLCQAQRLNPFAGDAYLVGFDKREQDGSYTAQFSLIVAHSAVLKRAEVHDDFEGMESGIILLTDEGVVEREGDFKLADENCVGGWARVYRKGRKPTYRRLSIASMKPKYETPFWNDDKAPGQIVKCAEADALRSTFPTLLGNLYTGEEAGSVNIPSNIEPDVRVLPEPKPEKSADDDGDLGPVKEAKKSTVHEEFGAFLTENKITFSTFQKWSEESGNVPDAMSLPDLSAVPEDVLKRLLRAKTGLLAGLKAAQGQ